ncbi:MAG: serine hydroxymethyltransferase, partial [Planctomycetota bacterium]|nr:serine hydroxymethyltransferase [Planctomycetota bacterium]
MFAIAPSKKKTGSHVNDIRDAERCRQWEHLVLIPSESICFPEAEALLIGGFGNIYAEGRPKLILCHDSRRAAGDAAMFEAWHRRLGDCRFYRGCVNADRVESLAQRYVAEAFAALPGSPPAGDIHANVQALSGAPANMAVYTALLRPGDTVMGLDLSNGGHLTHGSIFNFSGRAYRAVPYRVNPETRKLDYGAIRALAIEHRPRMIIGGASAYPWDFDWPKMREIADEVGAYLLADVAHLAGMIVAGVLSNPLPFAHVVTFTTHKTLCGPRGAVILSCDPDIRSRLDAAVFPGLQGGPHVNTIAAIARLFEIILERREDFARLQRTIVDNAAFMASCMMAEGFPLEYGGTNTHMLLVDLKRFDLPHCPGGRLDGETAARLLEQVGIVCNKNTLPGDDTAGHSTGIRLGMPWLTQRGISRDQIRELCSIIKLVLSSARAFRVWVPCGEERCRGRVPLDVLEEGARRVRAIAESLPYPARPPKPGRAVEKKPLRIGRRKALFVRGEKAALAVNQMLTARISALEPGRWAASLMLDGRGNLLDDVLVRNLGPAGGEDRFAILPHADRYERVKAWMRRLSDGYVLM